MASKLPVFEPLHEDNILPASILLFYGGNWLTELGGRIYKHPYKPAAYHAAGYIGRYEVLNIGKTATIEDIRSLKRSTRRIDVITLLDLNGNERDTICRKFRRDAGKNIYDVGGYARFASKLKVLRFLKFARSSRENDFCSDNVVDNFSEPPLKHKGEPDEVYKSLLLPRAIEVSAQKSEDTAPWHLLEHALANPSTRRVNTAWIGTEFKS